MTKVERPDVIVIGAGVAGVAAALSARREGASVLVVDGHAGASALGSGAWDVATDPDATLDDIFSPRRTIAQEIARVRRDHPHHPYAALGEQARELVAAAHELVLTALGIFAPLDLDGHGALVVTDVGLVRRAATAQRPVLYLAAHTRATVAVGVLRGYRAVDGAFVAASLADLADQAGDERRFTSIDVEFFRRRDDAVLHPHEVAAIADAADGRERLVASLSRAVAGMGFAAVLLPPVLGLLEDGVAADVSAQLDARVGELVTPLAGPQSLRLLRRIDAALEGAGCERLRASVARIVPDRSGTRVEIADGGKVISAGAVVVATGKHVGGGLGVRRGEVRETLASLPIYSDGLPMALASSESGRDPVVLFGKSPFASGPGFRCGVGYDEELRALGDSGDAASPDLFVAGALLDGFDPGRDGTGAGCAATTGFVAGLNAAKHAARSPRTR